MKRHYYALAITLISILAGTTAFADVKLKTKQTMAGQSYENTTLIKGKRQRSESMNGASVSLTQCDLRRSVQINPNAKTYMVTPFPETSTTTTRPTSTGKPGEVTKGGVVTSTITVKDTGERKQMFGYTARHLIITIETASSPDACNKTNMKMQQDGWYIDAEFALDCDYGYAGGGYFNNGSGGCKDTYQVKNVGTGKRGYPVYEKMTMFDESGKETYTMVNEVVELSKATLEASLFDVPGDYRQVTDSAQLYTASATNTTGSRSSIALTSGADMPANSGSAMSQYSGAGRSEMGASGLVGPKRDGVVRIGLANVKTGTIGDGITAADLASAVQNSLIQYLKAPNLEVVPLEAKLDNVIESEARQKECDYIIFTTVSHKKGGGGGFGSMFGKALGTAIGQTGIGHTGSVAGNIAGQVATQAIVSATTVSAQVKSKDELTLDVRATKADGTSALANTYKAKAKSNGDDIVSQVVEQAAQAIVSGFGR
jgi:hypothetical protein